MSQQVKWNERFSKEGYAYGEDANEFLKSTINFLPRGRILCIGEGEGRNALFLMETYSTNQLNFNTGGPKSIDLLLDLNEVRDELEGLNFVIAREIEREIIEGDYHTGLGSVVQIAGVKK